jgi:hypothetical protein
MQNPMAVVPTRVRFGLFALLAGALLIGLAQILVLPPWEGFDETAHYSYVQQLAETGRWPRFGEPIAAGSELDRDRAVTTARFRVDGVTYERQLFASHPDGVIVMRLSADRPGSLSFTLKPTSAHRWHHRKAIGGDQLSMQGIVPVRIHFGVATTDVAGAIAAPTWPAAVAAIRACVGTAPALQP